MEAACGVESCRSASVGVAINPGVRAHMVAYRLFSTLGSPPVVVVVPMTVLAKILTVGLPQLLSEWPGPQYPGPPMKLPRPTTPVVSGPESPSGPHTVG